MLKAFKAELMTKRTYYLLCAASGFAWAAAIVITYSSFITGFWFMNNLVVLAWALLVQGGIVFYYHHPHRRLHSFMKGLAVTIATSAVIIGGARILASFGF
ncbi:MAG: hypothetical protein SCL54_10570 [Bacillota bacterium]|nr:hypothetical protein [Bacillota bacterium]